VVGLWSKSSSDAYGINQQAYGGMEDWGQNLGAWWDNLTDSTVEVHRAADDPFAYDVRVCITISDPPAYNSGWVDISPGQTRTLTHYLGCDVNGYVVRMEFKDTDVGGIGINHENAGGNAIGDTYVGANWEDLTDHTIDVLRRPKDQHTDQVRIRAWIRPTDVVYLPLVVRGQWAGSFQNSRYQKRAISRVSRSIPRYRYASRPPSTKPHDS
jgi:hypothetical protein